MAYQLQEINDRLRADAKGFVEECEHNYQRRIEAAADRIVANMDKSPIVLLSGPSGSDHHCAQAGGRAGAEGD